MPLTKGYTTTKKKPVRGGSGSMQSGHLSEHLHYFNGYDHLNAHLVVSAHIQSLVAKASKKNYDQVVQEINQVK